MEERAAQLAASNRWSEAISVNREIVEREPDNWSAWVNLGKCCARAGLQQPAIDSYRSALAIRRAADLHNELGVVLLDAGDGDAAVREFRHAVALEPENAMALSNLGNALRLINERPAAREALERSLSINGANAEAHGNLGNLLRDLGESRQAIEHLQACIRLVPGRPEAHAFLAGALLEAGQPAKALRALENALRLDPVNRTAFAYKAAALQETGDYEAARFILDLEQLIDARIFTEVPGFDSVEEFNQQLSKVVLEHPTLSFERVGNATRHGSHTANLLANGNEVTAQFQRMVDGRIREYFANREIRPNHPFLAHRIKSWSTVAWGVVMRSGGHQIPHIHPSAWLSGVYYARVPSSVRKDSETREGWIEFGSPPASLRCERQEIRKFLFPEAGKMILFPSYFYHRTVPLQSDEARISIAFDVAPGRPGQHSA